MKLFGLFIAASLILFLIFYWTGLWLEWNFYYSWFDQILHLAGGFLTVAIFQYFFSRFYGDVFKKSFWLELVIGLSFVALVGVLWELHEFVADWWLQKPFLQGGVSDTISDLFLGLVGGMIFILLNKLLWVLKKKLLKSRFQSSY